MKNRPNPSSKRFLSLLPPLFRNSFERIFGRVPRTRRVRFYPFHLSYRTSLLEDHHHDDDVTEKRLSSIRRVSLFYRSLVNEKSIKPIVSKETRPYDDPLSHRIVELLRLEADLFFLGRGRICVRERRNLRQALLPPLLSPPQCSKRHRFI